MERRGCASPSAQADPQWISAASHMSTLPASHGSARTCAHGIDFSGCMCNGSAGFAKSGSQFDGTTSMQPLVVVTVLRGTQTLSSLGAPLGVRLAE